jgi:hypothetical protein
VLSFEVTKAFSIRTKDDCIGYFPLSVTQFQTMFRAFDIISYSTYFWYFYWEFCRCSLPSDKERLVCTPDRPVLPSVVITIAMSQLYRQSPLLSLMPFAPSYEPTSCVFGISHLQRICRTASRRSALCMWDTDAVIQPCTSPEKKCGFSIWWMVRQRNTFIFRSRNFSTAGPQQSTASLESEDWIVYSGVDQNSKIGTL